MWHVAHGAGFIQDGLLGQIEHQLAVSGGLRGKRGDYECGLSVGVC